MVIVIDYGKCIRCKRDLEESEFVLGDACDGCRSILLQEWEDEQDALAEARDEARRYPEHSDDDDDTQCIHYGGSSVSCGC